MTASESDLEMLLTRAANNDAAAVADLMELFRSRLRRLIDVRLHRGLRGRVDPSDVVQETLYDAARRLPQYLTDRPIAFYPWLRRLAIQRLIDAHRMHMIADRRSVSRETSSILDLSDESELLLAGRLVASGTTPSQHVIRRERQQKVRDALLQLPEREREVLVLRYLESLEPSDIADVLDVSERTVWRWHRQALERLGDRLSDELKP